MATKKKTAKKTITPEQEAAREKAKQRAKQLRAKRREIREQREKLNEEIRIAAMQDPIDAEAITSLKGDLSKLDDYEQSLTKNRTAWSEDRPGTWTRSHDIGNYRIEAVVETVDGGATGSASLSDTQAQYTMLTCQGGAASPEVLMPQLSKVISAYRNIVR